MEKASPRLLVAAQPRVWGWERAGRGPQLPRSRSRSLGPFANVWEAMLYSLSSLGPVARFGEVLFVGVFFLLYFKIQVFVLFVCFSIVSKFKRYKRIIGKGLFFPSSRVLPRK